MMSLAANWRYTRIRWWIVGMLFLATVLNYVDRQALSILSHTLREELGLTEADYSNVVSAFLVSYLVMYTVSGRLIDRFGVRIGAAACVAWWSVASMLTAFARGPWSLASFRFLLGVGEPGIFPAGVKACGEWFPKSMRALPTGLFSSGAAIGAIIAAPLVSWITLHFGWRMAFFLPGAIGLLWIPFWWFIYRSPSQHPALTPEERRTLEDEAPTGERKSWRELLAQRKVWGLVLPRLASDPVWYFYLFWLPDYFQRIRHLSIAEIGIYGWIPFLFADLGCVVGGAASDWLIRRGWPAPRARFAILVAVGVLAPFGALVGFMESTAAAIALTCLITFLCQAWSTNIATLNADLSDRKETGTIMGMMGSAGGVGGILFAQVLAITITALGYSSAFVLAALLHPVAAIALFLLLRPWLSRSGEARSGKAANPPKG
jgi:MFS transporter, ACS family, hexuronate transporter